MRRVLALETSGAVGSVALLVGATLSERIIPTPREQTELILEHVQTLIAEAGITLAELDGIAFGRGPGSFTGLRVATAVAQGFALALDVPLLPVSSLAAIAQGVWRVHGVTDCLVCIDARMDEVFWAQFAVEDGLATLAGTEHLSAPAAVEYCGKRPWLAAGTGYAAYPAALEHLARQASQVVTTAEPAARDLLPLALRALDDGRVCALEQALPAYLRREDAWQR